MKVFCTGCPALTSVKSENNIEYNCKITSNEVLDSEDGKYCRPFSKNCKLTLIRWNEDGKTYEFRPSNQVS